MELIRLEGICKSYRRGDLEIPVLQGVSLTIQRGELVALVGVRIGPLRRPQQR